MCRSHTRKQDKSTLHANIFAEQLRQNKIVEHQHPCRPALTLVGGPATIAELPMSQSQIHSSPDSNRNPSCWLQIQSIHIQGGF